MEKLVTCLALLLSFGVGHLRTMSLEDGAEDFAELPEDSAMPRREWLHRDEWDVPAVPVAKRAPFLDEESQPAEPAIDPETLLRAAIAMRREKEEEEEAAAAEEEAEKEKAKAQMEAALKRPTSHVRDVTPQELQELFGEAPRKKKAERPVKKSDLLRQYLRSALEKKNKEKKAAKRRKRVVKRGAVPPEEPKEEEAEVEASPRQVLLKELLLANALLNAENGYLTEALNAATIAQTNGNDRATLKREMRGIENAEKIQAVMEKLKEGHQMVKEARKESRAPEAIDETVVVTDNSIANLEACSAVKEMSTGCRVVKETYRFSMDQDATDACDAHSVCYGCSSAMRNTRLLCDQIFLAQSRNLCTQEADREQCEEEADTLLRAMQSAHEGNYLTSPQREKACNNPCVDAFFSAVYRPRR